MRLPSPPIRGTFLRRYKRFLVDVALADGSVVVAHSTNTGSLAGCLKEGAPVWLLPAANPERKLKYTWIVIRAGRSWVGVDTSLAVPLVEEALDGGVLPELGGYTRRIREVKYGRTGESRIDLLLARGGTAPQNPGPRALWPGEERLYVEVKNTTLRLADRRTPTAAFPDAVTERGLKHLHELEDVARKGQRAAIVFVAQRSDVSAFAPADSIHPEYGATLRRVMKRGVEVYALAARFGRAQIRLDRRLEIVT